MHLCPDDPEDPYVFRIDMSEMGKPPMPVVFTGGSDGAQPAERLCFGETVFPRRADVLNPRLLATGALSAATTAVAIPAAVRRAANTTPT